MSDFGEYSWPKGRKEYRCEWCGEKILKDEIHAHFVGKWEGEFQDWRVHRECEKDMHSIDLQDGFTPYGNERPAAAIAKEPVK